MLETDLEIRLEGGGGGGGGLPKTFFQLFEPQFGLKIRGLPEPPEPLP